MISKRHHTGPIPPKGHRTIDRARAMYSSGRTVEEVASALGVCRKSALDYRARVTRETGPVGVNRGRKYKHEATRCPVCSLRMFSGACEFCLPTGAVAFLGRSGEPAACATGLHHVGQ